MAFLFSGVSTFQSTLSQGERLGGEDSDKPVQVISIHALARRATLILTIYHWMSVNFNPRSRKESDIVMAI